MSRTAAEINSYCDGGKAAFESVIESLDLATSRIDRDDLLVALREGINNVERSRSQMLARIGEPR